MKLFYTGCTGGLSLQLASILDCREGKLPTKYLGLQLTNRALQKENWTGVIDKIQKRIYGWHAKLLAKKGRFTLVNSVLSYLLLYFFSIYMAPKWLVNYIEALRRNFFWKGCTECKGGACMAAWQNVCRD